MSTAEERASEFALLKRGEDVAVFVGASWQAFRYCIYRMPVDQRYRAFEIGKRGGGTRTIEAPITQIKSMQESLLRRLETVYVPRAAVHGFTFERSIVTNARRHVGCQWLLNIDLEDFFPTIHIGRVIGLFKATPFNTPDRAAKALAQLCTHNGRLPQGAPTSPIISNMICFRMDRELTSLARNLRCTYTRYADDISISTRQTQMPGELASIGNDGSVQLGGSFSAVLAAAQFVANSKKMRLQNRRHRMVVTGLKVNQFPNVRRTLISQIRAMLHAWKKFGLPAAEREFAAKYDRRSKGPRLSPRAFRYVLLGKLLFLGQVRGFADKRFTEFARNLYELDPQLLPKTPSYAVSQIAQAATCVLAAEDESNTGSGFFLANVGLITCHHVAKWATRAFYPDQHGEYFPIRCIESNRDSDLAVCETALPPRYRLKANFGDLRNGTGVFMHGFPRYNPGFRGQFQHGEITGRRQVFGYTRYLVSMRILAGNSGGPVLNAYGDAVGVAATGDTFHEHGYDPVDYGVIPLRHLQNLKETQAGLG